MNWYEIIERVVSCIALILCVLNAIFSKGANKKIKEIVMKYRTPNYREKVEAEAQSFDPLVTQYRYNKTTGELEELPDKLDIQKLVDSSLNTALEAMFDKYLPSEIDDIEQDLTDNRDKLDRLSDAMNFADTLKEELKLDPFASIADVNIALQKRIDEAVAAQKAKDSEEQKKARAAALRAEIAALEQVQGVKNET